MLSWHKFFIKTLLSESSAEICFALSFWSTRHRRPMKGRQYHVVRLSVVPHGLFKLSEHENPTSDMCSKRT